MRQRKVDLQQLHHLSIQGKTGREIAAEMGVGPGAISKNLKALRHALTGDYGRVAAKIDDQSVINMNRIEKHGLVLDSEIEDVRREISGASDNTEKDMLRQTLIKFLAESRKQTLLKFNIEKSIYQMIEGKQFQNDVLMKLREIGDEKREKFFNWLDTQTLDEGSEGDGSLRVSEAD